MSKPIKPVLRPWSDLSAREQSPRTYAEQGKDRAVEVVYILDPARIQRIMQACELSDPGPQQRARACQRAAEVCRIWILSPRDGHGEQPLRILVAQSEQPGNADSSWIWYAAEAKGCGYDKLTAALEGCPILAAGEGVTLGDHCDRQGRPRLRELCDARGWMVLGDLS